MQTTSLQLVHGFDGHKKFQFSFPFLKSPPGALQWRTLPDGRQDPAYKVLRIQIVTAYNAAMRGPDVRK